MSVMQIHRELGTPPRRTALSFALAKEPSHLYSAVSSHLFVLTCKLLGSGTKALVAAVGVECAANEL